MFFDNARALLAKRHQSARSVQSVIDRNGRDGDRNTLQL
jgi:hypothetical protein